MWHMLSSLTYYILSMSNVSRADAVLIMDEARAWRWQTSVCTDSIGYPEHLPVTDSNQHLLHDGHSSFSSLPESFRPQLYLYALPAENWSLSLLSFKFVLYFHQPVEFCFCPLSLWLAWSELTELLFNGSSFNSDSCIKLKWICFD